MSPLCAVLSGTPSHTPSTLFSFALSSIQAQPPTCPQAEHPDAGPTDAAKALGAEWRALSDQDKAPYVKMTEADKARYEEAMKSYVPPIDPPASTKRKKAKKDPDAPKGPKSAYILFSADRRKSVLPPHHHYFAIFNSPLQHSATLVVRCKHITHKSKPRPCTHMRPTFFC